MAQILSSVDSNFLCCRLRLQAFEPPHPLPRKTWSTTGRTSRRLHRSILNFITTFFSSFVHEGISCVTRRKYYNHDWDCGVWQVYIFTFRRHHLLSSANSCPNAARLQLEAPASTQLTQQRKLQTKCRPFTPTGPRQIRLDLDVALQVYTCSSNTTTSAQKRKL